MNKISRVVHFELNVKDIKRAIKFYEKTFDWGFVKWEGPTDYWLITTGDESTPGINGGLGEEEKGFPNLVNTINVKNVDQVIQKVKQNGGKIVSEKHAVPGVGWLAYFKDTEGIMFGIMEEDPTAK